MRLSEADMEERQGVTATNSFELLVQGVVEYGIYMLDPSGRVASWNIGAERIKGYCADEIIGQHFSTFYTPEDRDAGLPERALQEAVSAGRFSAEAWRVRKDGTRFWAMVVIDPIWNAADGKLLGFAKVTRDLTEQHTAQMALERSREQLFQLQKMEAVGQLTGGLAHDFNNLLAGIMGGLELLKMRIDQGRTDGLANYIEIASSAAARAASLTHRLLAFSRRQTLDPRHVQANILLADMLDLIRSTIGPTVEIEADIEPNLWVTFCDPNQLENAILNLAINARDAMDGTGNIIIRTSNAEVDGAMAADFGLQPGEYVAVCISDTGIGMTLDVLEHAFEPFFTTKPSGQGTGLGLSMVYGFAMQSGGGVVITTQPGVGTSVCVYLPRSTDADLDLPDHQTRPPSDVPRAADRHVVLVVDDEPTVRTFVLELLDELGYLTLSADDGPSGLNILNSNQHIDLLVTDVGLPGGLNGRQMADAARPRRPDLPVLYITGYAQHTVFGDAPIEPGTRLLTKPFGLDDLATTVRAMLR